MIREAAAAGFFDFDFGRSYARIQILTIEGPRNGTECLEHPDHGPNINFKKARREKNGKGQKSFADGDSGELE
jgi:hypothetical protein